MLKCLHGAVSVEDGDVGEKLKSLHMDCSSKKCGNKGWRKAARLQLQGNKASEVILYFTWEDLEHIYVIMVKGKLTIHR